MRPKPTVLMDYTDPKTYKAEQVLKAPAIFAVFLDGSPINLRSLNKLIDYPGPKYKKSSFSNEGHAHRLAHKLNKLFGVDRFAVFALTSGVRLEKKVYSDDPEM